MVTLLKMEIEELNKTFEIPNNNLSKMIDKYWYLENGFENPDDANPIEEQEEFNQDLEKSFETE